GDALAPRVAFGQSDAGEWRLREHAVRNQPIPRAALRPGQIVRDDPKVVARYVRELGTPSAFPDRPDPGGTRLEPLVDTNVSPDHPAGRRPPRGRSRRCSECAPLRPGCRCRSPAVVRTTRLTLSPDRPCMPTSRTRLHFQGGARGSLSPVAGRPLSRQTTGVP